VTDARPELAAHLDLKRAWAPAANGAGLPLRGLRAGRPHPIVLLLDPRARRGAGSVVVRQSGDVPRGGMTIVNLAGEEA
jgi:hypothetical protein